MAAAAKTAATKKPDVYVPDPTTNLILTSIFLAEVLGALLSLSTGAIPHGCPLPAHLCGVALIVACVVIFPTITAVKVTSARVGRVVSRTVLAGVGDPLRKTKTMHKFQDQMWQLFIHVTMTAFEYYILFVHDGGAEVSTPIGAVNWWGPSGYVAFWSPPAPGQLNSTPVHVFYLIQLAIWFDTCFSHCFIEERHKDYVMMYLHHIVTIMLVWGSYSYNYLRIGTVVLFVHDSSDIFVDLLKIFNYLKLEGKRVGWWRRAVGPAKGLFLVEITFLSNLIAWAYLRLFIYPVRCVYYGVWYGAREVVEWHLASGFQHPDLGPVPAERLMVKNGRVGKPLWTIGQGDFDIWEDMRLNPTNQYLKLYWATGSLLTVLFIMHIIWYLMFWRILYRMLTMSGHEAGEEVYEGGSDDEDKKD